jgi:hypothetical protein
MLTFRRQYVGGSMIQPFEEFGYYEASRQVRPVRVHLEMAARP